MSDEAILASAVTKDQVYEAYQIAESLRDYPYCPPIHTIEDEQQRRKQRTYCERNCLPSFDTTVTDHGNPNCLNMLGQSVWMEEWEGKNDDYVMNMFNITNNNRNFEQVY